MIVQNNIIQDSNKQTTIPINPNLVWDYDIPPEGKRSDAFWCWYIARVLTRGQAKDIQAIGIKTIHHYFPSLNLPSEIHHFWQWYFNLPKVKQRYGDTYPITTSSPNRN